MFCQLIRDACSLLPRLRSLCAPSGWLALLPSCLLITLGVIRESSRHETMSTTMTGESEVLPSDQSGR